MGYMGYLNVQGAIYPCNSIDYQVKTNVQYYDHVVGLQDSSFGSFAESKGKGGNASSQIQKFLYRYSPFLPTTSVSGPALDAGGFKTLLTAALNFSPLSSVIIAFKDKEGVSLTDSYISSFGFEVSAADILSYRMELISKEAKDISPSSLTGSCAKIITWDVVNVTSFAGTTVSAISCSIDNAPQVIYSAGTDDLFPYEIRPGMQSISGTIASYASESPHQPLDEDMVKIAVSGQFLLDLKVAFEPSGADVNAGPFINTTPFKGVNSSGSVWALS